MSYHVPTTFLEQCHETAPYDSATHFRKALSMQYKRFRPFQTSGTWKDQPRIDVKYDYRRCLLVDIHHIMAIHGVIEGPIEAQYDLAESRRPVPSVG